MTASVAYQAGAFSEASLALDAQGVATVTLRRHGYQGQYTFRAAAWGTPQQHVIQDTDVPWTD